MTTLPDVNDLIDGGTTEALFQSAMEEFYNYTAQLVVGSTTEALDIDNGVVIPTKTFIIVDTENDTASDNLDRIDATNLGVKTLYLKIASSSRAVVLRHAQGGSGQLHLVTGANLTVDNLNMVVVFHYNAGSDRWEEIWRNFGVFTPSGSSQTAARAALGLGTASQVNTGTASGAVPLNSDLGDLAYIDALSSSSQVGNGIITNDKLSGGITLAKFANTVPNSVYSVNGSGVPALLTPTVSGSYVGYNGSGVGFIAPAAGPIVSVGQGDLRSSIGDVGALFYSGAKSHFFLPGGGYGFYPQVFHTNGSNSMTGIKVSMMDTMPVAGDGSGAGTISFASYTPTTVATISASASAGGYYIYLRTRYITASPPYSLPDGPEAAGFIYGLMETNGEITSLYVADTPPWVYNGPTKCFAEVVDPDTGVKYRRKSLSNIQNLIDSRGKTCGAPRIPYDEQLDIALKGERRLARELLEARSQLGRETFGIIRNQIQNNIIAAVQKEILLSEYEPITMEMKNADMHLIPHPFASRKPDQQVVLIGLYDDRVRGLIDDVNNGEDLIKHFAKGTFRADNDIKVGVSPKGVKLVDLKVK